MIFTVVGNIGAGKSTIMPIIATLLDADVLDADNLFQTSDPFAQRYLENPARWAMVNELWLTNERVKLVEDKINDLDKTNLVIDSGILMSWVYVYSHFISGNIGEEEWQLYQELYDRLCKNCLKDTAVIYLDYSIPTLIKRIQKRGRDYELTFYNANYLEQIQHGLSALIRKLEKADISIISIKEDAVADFENSSSDKKMLKDIVRNYV